MHGQLNAPRLSGQRDPPQVVRVHILSRNSGDGNAALPKTQAQLSAQQQLARELERPATEERAAQSVPQPRRGAARQHPADTMANNIEYSVKLQVKRASQRQRRDPYVPDRWARTGVLLAAELEGAPYKCGPLTFTHPCVHCCSALWAWCCAAPRFLREAKENRFFVRQQLRFLLRGGTVFFLTQHLRFEGQHLYTTSRL